MGESDAQGDHPRQSRLHASEVADVVASHGGSKAKPIHRGAAPDAEKVAVCLILVRQDHACAGSGMAADVGDQRGDTRVFELWNK